ncbi:MAG: guanylate kinase [Actinomycetota bacterium]
MRPPEPDPIGNGGRLFVISGPSGAGKSSVVRGLKDRRPFYFSVSATTRLPRPGEKHGVHYWFVEPTDFAALIADDDLLEWAEYNGHRYGTLRQPVLERLTAGDDVLLEIEVQGARKIRLTHPAAVMFFVMPPTLADLGERLRRRGDTAEEEIDRRLQIARREIEQAEGLFDHTVINDDLSRCIDEIDRLMESA